MIMHWAMISIVSLHGNSVYVDQCRLRFKIGKVTCEQLKLFLDRLLWVTM
jgi:hypothetical protein